MSTECYNTIKKWLAQRENNNDNIVLHFKDD